MHAWTLGWPCTYVSPGEARPPTHRPLARQAPWPASRLTGSAAADAVHRLAWLGHPNAAAALSHAVTTLDDISPTDYFFKLLVEVRGKMGIGDYRVTF